MGSDTSLLYQLKDLKKPTLQQLHKAKEVPLPADKTRMIDNTFKLPLKD